MVQITNMPSNGEGYEIIPRNGPMARDYLTSFIDFVRQRTGFQFGVLRTPHHLKRVLDELAFNRVPIMVWQGLLESALKIASMSRTIDQGLRQFGAFFIDVLCWFFRRLTSKGLLKLALFLYGSSINPWIGMAIGIIYYVIEFFLDPLWGELSKFLQSRMISAPYYRFLTV